MRQNQRGFSASQLLVLAVVIIIVGVFGWYVATHRTAAQITGASNLATLSGTVSSGPTSPICPSQGDCGSSTPIANHTMQILNRDGKVVDTTATDINGHYNVHIPTGYYSFKLVPSVGLGTKNSEVDVKAGNNTFNLVIDSGIR